MSFEEKLDWKEYRKFGTFFIFKALARFDIKDQKCKD